MAAGRGIDDILPTAAALAVASAALEEVQRRDSFDTRDGGERPACEAHPVLEEEAKHQHACVIGRRCWRIKTSLTPRTLRRSSFEPTSACPILFSRSKPNLLKVTPLHQTSPEKHKNCTFDPRDDKKGSYQQFSGKIYIYTIGNRHFQS